MRHFDFGMFPFYQKGHMTNSDISTFCPNLVWKQMLKYWNFLVNGNSIFHSALVKNSEYEVPLVRFSPHYSFREYGLPQWPPYKRISDIHEETLTSILAMGPQHHASLPLLSSSVILLVMSITKIPWRWECPLMKGALQKTYYKTWLWFYNFCLSVFWCRLEGEWKWSLPRQSQIV